MLNTRNNPKPLFFSEQMQGGSNSLAAETRRKVAEALRANDLNLTSSLLKPVTEEGKQICGLILKFENEEDVQGLANDPIITAGGIVISSEEVVFNHGTTNFRMPVKCNP